METPFSLQIMNEAIPPKFKMPHMEPYDGTTDPLDHLESFKAMMLFHGATGDIVLGLPSHSPEGSLAMVF